MAKPWKSRPRTSKPRRPAHRTRNGHRNDARSTAGKETSRRERRIARRGEPATPAEIATHDTIQFGALTASSDWHFVADGREVRVACTPRFITNSADAAIWHAEQGGGLTRVLAYQAADAIKAGRLKIVLATFEPPPLPIHIVYPTSRLLSAKVRTFVDLVIEVSDWKFGKR
jgi:DNA-binding transcriptional LysR family regulator